MMLYMLYMYKHAEVYWCKLVQIRGAWQALHSCAEPRFEFLASKPKFFSSMLTSASNLTDP